eukprot:s3195_g5.t1
MRERLEAPDMSAPEASQHLETVDPDQPWLTEIGFLQAVLAHLSLFYDEVQKVTYAGVSLHRLILNMASRTKVQWLLYRHSVERESLVLLPSGTTSIESLHHEINHWFRETAALHKATLVMKLDFFQFVKVFTHNQALSFSRALCGELGARS